MDEHGLPTLTPKKSVIYTSGGAGGGMHRVQSVRKVKPRDTTAPVKRVRSLKNVSQGERASSVPKRTGSLKDVRSGGGSGLKKKASVKRMPQTQEPSPTASNLPRKQSFKKTTFVVEDEEESTSAMPPAQGTGSLTLAATGLPMNAEAAKEVRKMENYKAENEDDRLMLHAFINIFIVMVAVLMLLQSGQSSNLYRTQASFDSQARALDLLSNETSLASLNSASSIRTWLEFQFVPGILEEQSFAKLCNFHDDDFDFPHFWIRGLSASSRSNGCEDPTFWLSEPHTVNTNDGDVVLHPADRSKDVKACIPVSNTEEGSNGFYLFGAAFGTNCEHYLNVSHSPTPAPTPSPAQDTASDIGDTFECSAMVHSSVCTAEVGGKDNLCYLNDVDGQTYNEDAWTYSGMFWGNTLTGILGTSTQVVELKGNETCQAQWTKSKKSTQRTFGAFVGDFWESYFLRNISTVFIGAHLPLGNGDSVDVNYIVSQSRSGLVSTEYSAHVEPGEGVDDHMLVGVNILLAFVCFAICIAVLRDIIRFLERMLCCSQYRPGIIEVVVLYSVGAGIGFLLWRKLTQLTHLAYYENRIPPKSEENRFLDALDLLLLIWVLSIILGDLHIIITKPFTYLFKFWHVIDWCCICVIIVLRRFRELFDDTYENVLDAVADRALTFPPYFQQWHEEFSYFYMERDPTMGAVFGALMFFVTLRVLRYLSLFPALYVPMKTLVHSMREFFSFLVVLILLTLCFNFIFLFSFGATIEEFSGFSMCLTSLMYALTGAFNFDVFDGDPRMGFYGVWIMITYIFIVGILFMNMLIAIILHHYLTLKSVRESSKMLTDSNRKRLLEAGRRMSTAFTEATGVRMSTEWFEDEEEVGSPHAEVLPFMEWENDDPSQYPPRVRQAMEKYKRLRQAYFDQQQSNRKYAEIMMRELSNQVGAVNDMIGGDGEVKASDDPNDELTRTRSLPAKTQPAASNRTGKRTHSATPIVKESHAETVRPDVLIRSAHPNAQRNQQFNEEAERNFNGLLSDDDDDDLDDNEEVDQFHVDSPVMKRPPSRLGNFAAATSQQPSRQSPRPSNAGPSYTNRVHSLAQQPGMVRNASRAQNSVRQQSPARGTRSSSQPRSKGEIETASARLASNNSVFLPFSDPEKSADPPQVQKAPMQRLQSRSAVRSAV